MNTDIILASLRARPVRTAVSILAVALEVALILVVVGMSAGITGEVARRMEGVADLTIFPPGSSYILVLNNAVKPAALAGKIAELEGVKAVSPVLTQTSSKVSNIEVIWSIDPESFDQVSGGLVYLKGKVFSAPNEIVVDDWYAASNHVDVGSEVTLLSQMFKVTGIVQNGKGSRIFMPLKTGQDMRGMTGGASFFLVKLNNYDEIGAVTERVNQLLTNYIVINNREYTSLMATNNIPMLNAFIQSVVFVALCIGVLVIFLSMYTTITERTREIGILRSLGASKSWVMSMILQECVLLCLIGVALGVGASFGLVRILVARSPTLAVDMTPLWILKASGFAVISGIVGSIYPAIKAASQDPVEALAYE